MTAPVGTSLKATLARLAAGLGLGALAIASTATFASPQSDYPAYASVRRISFAGTGCPAGSVVGAFAADLTAFHLYLDDFTAETGPGIGFSDRRKNCQIAIDVDIPSGWSFTVADVQYHGYVALESGVAARQTSTYYFQGQAQQARLSSTVYGPLEGDYTIRDQIGVEGFVWSPCGLSRALNINSQVLLGSNDSRRRGLITLEEIDAHVEHLFGIQWRRCN